MSKARQPTAEELRLREDDRREKNWKRWGPYLAERQWGTVREDYSADGSCWTYFPHDHARSRAYRWGEDGLLGWCDRECRLCFAPALWNGRDPILKERMFGLTNPEGNHGEDVKECYFYLDSTPTHSYCKALYKYPQAPFPYAQLIEENAQAQASSSRNSSCATRAFSMRTATSTSSSNMPRAAPDDPLIRITVANRGPEAAEIHLLPTLWFRNTWTWGCTHEGCTLKPRMWADGLASVLTDYPDLAADFDSRPSRRDGVAPELLFTDNETNTPALFGTREFLALREGRVSRVCDRRANGDAVNPRQFGTKAAAYYRLTVPAGGQVSVRCRLSPADGGAGRAVRHRLRSNLSSSANARRTSFTSTRIHAVHVTRAEADRPAGVCGAALEQAVLQLRGQRLARWRSQRAAASARARPNPQRRLAARVCAGCAVDAGQMGISRGLPPGTWRFTRCSLSYLDPEMAKQQLLRVAARVVHASQRAVSGV